MTITVYEALLQLAQSGDSFVHCVRDKDISVVTMNVGFPVVSHVLSVTNSIGQSQKRLGPNTEV